MRSKIICVISILTIVGLYVGSLYYKDTRTEQERITDEIIENVNTHPSDWKATSFSQIEKEERDVKIASLQKDTSDRSRTLLAIYLAEGFDLMNKLSFNDFYYNYYENKKCNLRLKVRKPEPFFESEFNSIDVYQNGKDLFRLDGDASSELNEAIYAQLVEPTYDKYIKTVIAAQAKSDSITNAELKKVTICK